MALTLSETGSHWSILSRGVTRSDLGFKWMTLDAMWKVDLGGGYSEEKRGGWIAYSKSLSLKLLWLGPQQSILLAPNKGYLWAKFKADLSLKA